MLQPYLWIPLEGLVGISNSLSSVQQTNQMINLVNLFGPRHPSVSAIIKSAVDCLRADQIIALPTDTLYGIACLSQSSAAVKHLYHIKARNENKPVAICVSQVSDISKWGQVTVSEKLLNELLPGPVTLIFERTSLLNHDLNPGTNLVGIRIPDSWFIQQLAAYCSEPLALTSANISGAQSTLAVEEFSNIWNQLSVIYNGGPIPDNRTARLGSTVVDLSVPGFYRIVRPGCAESNTVAILVKHGLVECHTCEVIH